MKHGTTILLALIFSFYSSMVFSQQKQNLSEKEIVSYFNKQYANSDVVSVVFNTGTRLVPYDSLLYLFEKLLKNKLPNAPNYLTFPFDKESTKEPYRSIYTSIRARQEKTGDSNRVAYINRHIDLIKPLPPSFQKIRLILALAKGALAPYSFSYDISFFIDFALKETRLIRNDNEWLQSQVYIGDFALNHYFLKEAMQTYINALAYAGNCTGCSFNKQMYVGAIATGIASVFFSTGLPQGVEHADVYLQTALHAYSLSKKVTKAALIAASRSTNARIHLYWGDQFRFNTRETMRIKSEDLLTLYEISKLMTPTTKRSQDGYLIEDAIAVILNVHGEYASAAKANVAALINSYEDMAVNQLFHSLSFSTRLYTELKNYPLAMKAVELQLYLADKLKDPYGYGMAMLLKSEVLMHRQQWDSAAHIINQYAYDSTLTRRLFPNFINWTYETAFKNKVALLRATHRPDSINFFRNLIEQFFQNLQSEFIDLLKISEKAVTSNLLFYHSLEQKRSIDSMTMLEQQKKNLRLETEIAREKSKGDSIARKSAEIKSKNDSLARRNAELIAEQQRQQKKELMLIGAVIFVFGIGIAFYVFRRNRNKQQEKERQLQKQRDDNKLELDHLNELAKNKIHNIKNDYNSLSLLLFKKKYTAAASYTAAYGRYMKTFFENWDKPNVTLKEELNLLDRYVEVKRAHGRQVSLRLINRSVPPVDYTKTIFIQSVFDTLLDNSIRRGFANKTGECHLAITFSYKDSMLTCTVTDNGIPPKDRESYLRREGSALNILQKRVKGVWITKELPLPPDYFSVIQRTFNKGTEVKFLLPYEQVV